MPCSGSTSGYDRTGCPVRKSPRGGRVAISSIAKRRESAMMSAATPCRWSRVVMTATAVLLLAGCSGRADGQVVEGSSTSSIGPTTTMDPRPAILSAYRAHWATSSRPARPRTGARPGSTTTPQAKRSRPSATTTGGSTRTGRSYGEPSACTHMSPPFMAPPRSSTTATTPLTSCATTPRPERPRSSARPTSSRPRSGCA